MTLTECPCCGAKVLKPGPNGGCARCENTPLREFRLNSTRNKVAKFRGEPLVYNWAKKYERCIACGTTERKHNGNGLCPTCRNRWIKAGKQENENGTPDLNSFEPTQKRR